MFEFLKKFIMQTIDIEIITSDPIQSDDFTLRSKEFFKNFALSIPQEE